MRGDTGRREGGERSPTAKAHVDQASGGSIGGVGKEDVEGFHHFLVRGLVCQHVQTEVTTPRASGCPAFEEFAVYLVRGGEKLDFAGRSPRDYACNFSSTADTIAAALAAVAGTAGAALAACAAAFHRSEYHLVPAAEAMCR